MRECPSCYGKGTITVFRFNDPVKIQCPICRGEKFFDLSDNEKLSVVSKELESLISKLISETTGCWCKRNECCESCSGKAHDRKISQLEVLLKIKNLVNRLK